MIEPDWQYLQDIEIWRNNVKHKDLKTPDVRYDTVRLGYWVRTDSPTYSLLALKGCQFGRKWGQTVW
jgi:hypothetical protein